MPSETIQKGNTQRFRWVPPGAEKIDDPNGNGVAYRLADDKGRVIVMGFAGAAGNHSFYESYRKPELAENRISEFFANLQEHKLRVIARRAESNAGHELKIGDIISNSWGYDQTNVDFYKIMKTTKHFVWLQKIPGSLVEDGGCGPMSGSTVADREGTPFGPLTMHKATGKNVSMKFGSGSIWDGRPMYVSWYA